MVIIIDCFQFLNLIIGYMYVYIRFNVYVYLLCFEMNFVSNLVQCFVFF